MKNRLLFLAGALALPLWVAIGLLLGYDIVDVVFSIMLTLAGVFVCVVFGFLVMAMFGTYPKLRR